MSKKASEVVAFSGRIEIIYNRRAEKFEILPRQNECYFIIFLPL
jgi:hypothetical protein